MTDPVVTSFDPYLARLAPLFTKLPAPMGPLMAQVVLFVFCTVGPAFLLGWIVERIPRVIGWLRVGFPVGREGIVLPTSRAAFWVAFWPVFWAVVWWSGAAGFALAALLGWILLLIEGIRRADPIAQRERFWKKLLFCGLVVRMASVLVWRGPFDLNYSDAWRHYDNAKHFLEPGAMGCSNPYLYQLFLYLVLTVTKEDKLWVHLVNAVFSVAYPFVWYGFARTVLRRKVHALRFAGVLMFLPTHVVMFSFFMNESLLLPLLGGALWATSVAGKRRSGALFILASFLWVMAILTRSVVAPASIVALGWCLYRLRLRPVFAGLASAALVLSAVAAHPTVSETLAAVVLKEKTLLLGAAVAAFLVLAVGFSIARPRSRVVPLLAAWVVMAGWMGVAGLHSYKHLRRYTAFGDNTAVALYFAGGEAGYQITYPRGGTYVFGSPSLYISPFDPFFDWKSVRWKFKCPRGVRTANACDPKAATAATTSFICSETAAPQQNCAVFDTKANAFKFIVDPDKNGEDARQTLRDVLKKNRKLLPKLVLENILFTSFAHSWPDSGKESGPGVVCLWERWIWFPLFVVCVAKGVYVLRRRRRLYFVPVLAICMILGLYASQITVMEGRYRKPIEPMVVLSLFWLAP